MGWTGHRCQFCRRPPARLFQRQRAPISEKNLFGARHSHNRRRENTSGFPCVNPDGGEFKYNKGFLLRENRNPAHSNGDAKKIGVDINRNYDFMWDFKKFFHPAAWSDSLASDNPAIETFHGPKPFSEPETQNVRWLMDRFNPVLFLDLHS